MRQLAFVFIVNSCGEYKTAGCRLCGRMRRRCRFLWLRRIPAAVPEVET